MLGSVNYGRDADSTASMAGAIAGALHGEAAIPRDWAQQVSRSSKLEMVEMADALSNVASEIFASDRRHWEERTGNFPPAVQ